MGSTKVAVACHGPRSADARDGYSERGSLSVDVRRTPFAVPSWAQSKGGSGGAASGASTPSLLPSERDLASALSSLLLPSLDAAAFPKAVVELRGTVLESSGGELSALALAGSLALADAGVPLLDLVSAAAVAKVGGRFLLDPSLAEEARASARLTLAALPSVGTLGGIKAYGRFSSMQELRTGIELALEGGKDVDAVAREALVEAALEKMGDAEGPQQR